MKVLIIIKCKIQKQKNCIHTINLLWCRKWTCHAIFIFKIQKFSIQPTDTAYTTEHTKKQQFKVLMRDWPIKTTNSIFYTAHNELQKKPNCINIVSSMWNTMKTNVISYRSDIAHYRLARVPPIAYVIPTITNLQKKWGNHLPLDHVLMRDRKQNWKTILKLKQREWKKEVHQAL